MLERICVVCELLFCLIDSLIKNFHQEISLYNVFYESVEVKLVRSKRHFKHFLDAVHATTRTNFNNDCARRM